MPLTVLDKHLNVLDVCLKVLDVRLDVLEMHIICYFIELRGRAQVYNKIYWKHQ